MASHITRRPLIFQDENSDILPKKLGPDATTKKNPKSVVKKGVNVLGCRKALNDITNKSSKHHGTSSKKNLPKEFNIAEEMCFHDHKKCTEGQHKVRESCYLDSVLSEHKSLSDFEHLEAERAKTAPESPRCYPEPVELPISEFTDLVISTQWASPPFSPLQLSSPSPSLIHGTSSEKYLPKEEFAIADAMCLHDHKKCIEAKQKEREPGYFLSVLLEHKSLSDLEHLEFQRANTDPESHRCYSEPVELPMSEFSDWLISSIQLASSPSSPLALDSPPLSPISWNMEPNFVLKEENVGDSCFKPIVRFYFE